MLIEAICGYKVELGSEVGSIEEIRFVDLGTPLTDRDCIVSRDGLVAVFDGQILVFRVSGSIRDDRRNCGTDPSVLPGSVPKVFSVECEANIPNTADSGTKKDTRNVIREFESIYPSTDIHYTADSFVFVLEQPSRTVKQIISELRRLHPALSRRNGRYVTGNPEGRNMYIVRGVDGEIHVDISVLKRENVKGLYHNDNSSSLCLIGNNEISDMEKTDYVEKDALNDSFPGSTETVRSVMDSSERLEAIFEFSRSTDYTVLIKAFLRRLKPSRYCFVKHFYIQSIDGFYFTAFKIERIIVLIMSRKLYDYTKLANILHLFCQELVVSGMFLDKKCKGHDRLKNASQPGSKIGDFCTLCLSIPYLSQDGPLAITYEGESLVARYKVKDAGKMLTPILRSLFECDGVVLEEDENSFWNIQAIVNSLDPLKFPGLIVSPLSDEMRYLLEGPYPFIVSSEEWVEPENKCIRAFRLPVNSGRGIDEKPDFHSGPTSCRGCGTLCHEEAPNPKNAKDITHMLQKKLHKNSRIVRSLRSVIKGLAGIGKKENTGSRVDLFLKDKEKFIDTIVSTKSRYFLPHGQKFSFGIFSSGSRSDLSSGQAFPASFDAPTLIEKYFINEIKPFSCTYTFDLSGGVEFFPHARMSMRDALSLWMMIYPGEVDYESLLKTKDCNIMYLARRACIDRDVETVQRILRRVSRSNGVLKPWRSKEACKLRRSEQGRCNRGIPKSFSPLVRVYTSKRPDYSSQFRMSMKLNDVLSVIGSYDEWNLHEINSRLFGTSHNEADLSEGSALAKPQDGDIKIVECLDSARVYYKDSVYDLMTLENILGCIHNEFYNEQLRASVLAYLQEANLPARPSKYVVSGDLTIALL